MKIARTLLLVVFLASSFVVMASTQALACSCIPPRPDDKAIKDAAAVFTGTVIDIEDDVEIGFDPVTWTFAVDTVYKGDVAETQEIETHTQSAACGLVFKEEKRYAVFAHEGGAGGGSGDGLATNSCENTRPLAEGKELDLEPIKHLLAPTLLPKREGGSGSVVPFVAAGAAVGAVVLLAAVLLRRRRKPPAV